MRVVRWALAALAIVVIATVGLLLWYRQASLPVHEGTLLVGSLSRPVRIARDDIEEIQPSKVSVMPAGLDQQLTPRELADLVAFLKACK